MSVTLQIRHTLMSSNTILLSVYECLLADIEAQYGSPLKGGSDIGLDWAVNTAPLLEKQLLRCIEEGNSDLSMFPVWLSDLANRALTEPAMLRLIRQLLLFAYKADITCDHEKINATYQSFFDTNSAVGGFARDLSSRSPSLLKKVRKHVHSVLYQTPWKKIIPSHGPGAVFPKIRKGSWTQWFTTIESVYPYSDFFSLYYNRDQLALLDDTPRVDLIRAKLIAVRKDSRGPRLICVHPSEAIWIQKGLERSLVSTIVRRRFSNGPWPCGHIHFDDQTVNASLALSSSQSRFYATLDMKEASDRVSDSLVQILFGDHYKYFGCCRAQKIECPFLKNQAPIDDNIHSYAPMGNATTFPVQSIVFWAICVSTLESLGSYNPGDVYVFGDDLVVPAEHAPRIIESLESFGLLVNRNKSFWRGPFRESCGTDAFHGVDVTPLRWVKRPDISSMEEVVAACNLAMRLRIANYEHAATRLYREVKVLCKDHGIRFGLTNNVDHGSIAEYTDDYLAVRRRCFMHPRGLQVAVTSADKLCTNNIIGQHDWCHVLSSLCALERGAQQSTPLDSLSRRVCLTRGWIPVV